MKRFTVDCPAMKDWAKGPVRRTLGKVSAPHFDVQFAGLDQVDYAKLEADTLAAILAQYPGATVECHIHDEWIIKLPPAKKES